jgi:hypothetical protein
MVPTNRQRLNLIVDPRFSGGTTSAVAREIYALAPLCDLTVTAISSKLFKGQTVHPLIARACEDLAIPLSWDPEVVSSDVVALHNPSFLKFDSQLQTRIVCDRLFVVCHENFVRPDGPESFDVSHCLDLISRQAVTRKKYLSPVSAWNRQCAQSWLSANMINWEIAPLDWTNICDFDLCPPTNNPRNRRGRHSRPGAEKFPPLPDLCKMFPEDCESVRMLGADGLSSENTPRHWELLDFGSEEVDAFLKTIDFFVYFTHPFCQESFGRVIAEAIAAGKVVITSPATAATFGNAVISALPEDVDGIAARMIADPALYKAQVVRSQKTLTSFGMTAFQDRFEQLLMQTTSTPKPDHHLEMLYDFL